MNIDLDAIQRRLPYIPEDEMSQAERDRAHLFAYARDLEARIGRVESACDAEDARQTAKGYAAVSTIRAALASSDTP